MQLLCEDARTRSIRRWTKRALAALQLGRPHLDDLPAASDEGFQFTGGSRDQRLRYDIAHLTKVGDHCSVDAVCFRELALRASEFTNLSLTTATGIPAAPSAMDRGIS